MACKRKIGRKRKKRGEAGERGDDETASKGGFEASVLERWLSE